MNLTDKIFIAGHKGMVGSSIRMVLEEAGYTDLILRSKEELDLNRQKEVEAFFKEFKPQIVILAAAKVGGIGANIESPAQFLYDNLMIQSNIIHSAHLAKVDKIIFLGSSCIYPRDCPQPMKEEYLLTGRLEPTNEGYALAKIAGLKMLEYYKKVYGLNSISLMLPNLYGPNDSFDLHKSHVLSALVKRLNDAKKNNLNLVTLWGTGNSRREFMHVRDCAEAVLFFMNKYEHLDFINIGTGSDISIKDLANLIALKIGFKGEIAWDISKPDGMPRKCMEISKMIDYGFIPKIKLEDGIIEMIEIYSNILKMEKI